MSPKRSTLVVSALAAAAAALPAQAAEARTYCVGSLLTYTCPAGSIPTGESLQYALNLAQKDSEADTIKIGPGTFTSPVDGFDAVNDNPLKVSGSKGTILDATGQTDASPAFDAHSATLERFKLLTAAGTYRKGIVTRSAEVRDLTVVNQGQWGEGIVSRGSTMRRVVVNMTGVGAIGISALPDFFSTSVVASHVTADHVGIVTNKADAYVTRTRLYKGGAGARGGMLHITDSVIRLGDEIGEGVFATCAAGKATTTVTADHVTVLGGKATRGGAAHCWTNGVASKLTVKNSILATEKSLKRDENAGRSDIVAINNLLKPGADLSVDTGPLYTGTIYTSQNLQGTPTFVPGTVVLPSGSFLIDKAMPSKSVWDANYKPRPKDGNGDGVSAGDIGAVERQVP